MSEPLVQLLSPHGVFASLLGGGEAAILVDDAGLVVAGEWPTATGDAAADIAATLTGISEEAVRATRHLDIGDWRAITFETESAVVTLAPVPADVMVPAMVVVAAPSGAPLGALRRSLSRCLEAAGAWLRGAGGLA